MNHEDPHTEKLDVLTPTGWRDYALLDSGNGQKLERYGAYTFIRPEPQAMWAPALSPSEWRSAYATFIPAQEESGGHWQFHQPVPTDWLMHYGKLSFQVQTTAGRHLGVFPEQAAHWDWIASQVERSDRQVNVLNLFGYTGLATLSAAAAGARVTHVDASKKSLRWARHNQSLSGLQEKPVRWIVDDAIKFVQREGRRQAAYDGLILDPPKFGRGPKGEVWEFFKLLPALLEACRAVLSPQPSFVVLTAYAIRASAVSLRYSLQAALSDRAGEVTAGELALREASAGRLIPTAIYARWQAA